MQVCYHSVLALIFKKKTEPVNHDYMIIHMHELNNTVNDKYDLQSNDYPQKSQRIIPYT